MVVSPFAPRPPRSGSELVAEILYDEDVRYVFGNPGTTELPLIRTLARRRDIAYVLGLQETSVVAMADGYAHASGRVGVVNLHSSGGLGHAMGALLNAQLARTPMIITAGQQDLRHLALDPLLSGDLVGLARPAVKWAREVTHADQIPVLLRRAFTDSRAAPSGPVFLSLPVNIMEDLTPADPSDRSTVEYRSITVAIEALAVRLNAFPPGKLALVVGDEVSASGAEDEVARLAECLAAPVFGCSWPGHIAYPTGHPSWRGTLPTQAADIRGCLSTYDGIFLLGAEAIITYLYSDGPAVPPACEVLQLSSNAGDLARSYSTALACVGDILSSVKALLPLLDPIERDGFVAQANAQARLRRGENDAVLYRQLDEALAEEPISPFVAAGQIGRALGADTAIVDEAPATMNFLRSFLRSTSSKQYVFSRSAILGWGMPAAVGTSLGLDRQPVVAVIGDGSAMYSPQALWTAAHERLPVTFVIINNRSYGILKNAAARSALNYAAPFVNGFLGMELTDPLMDFIALAKAFGLPALRVAHATDIASAIEAGIESGLPNLVEIPVSYP
jgi:benzoylformate decarboxylase